MRNINKQGIVVTLLRLEQYYEECRLCAAPHSVKKQHQIHR